MSESDHELLLGNHTHYPTEYEPSILTPIPRQNKWSEMGIEVGQSLPFTGVDIWTAYELSWLTPSGKPVVAVGEIFVPATSPYLVESKSLKLYLNSLNQAKFDHIKDVKALIEKDLSAVAGAEITVKIVPVHKAQDYLTVQAAPGECIDEVDVEIDFYELDASVLVADKNVLTSEVIHSNLLKSNCPVTNQPDWATVVIDYHGPKIDRVALLKYLISYRQHNDFHEQCVERIFLDLKKYCGIGELTVYARYVRRGGLDINPYRSSLSGQPNNIRLVRQ
jgi:7-cyano-7-deazaguanine reductase